VKACSFSYHRPESVDSAVAMLAALAPAGGRVLAGGQSLVPMMAYRMAQPAHLIDVSRFAELQKIEAGPAGLRIGAGVRHAVLRRGAGGEMLAFVAGHIAHEPIRNRGTFGGSLANADPASEWCCVLAVLGGVVEARNAAGVREIPAAGFFAGVMSTALAEDELLTSVALPDLAGWRWGFYEVSRRAGDYALAMCLVAWRLEDGVMRGVRLGIGGAEAVPRRLPAAEAVLEGAAPGDAVFARAADAAAAGIDPMTDHNVGAAFRRDLARAAVRRALARAA